MKPTVVLYLSALAMAAASSFDDIKDVDVKILLEDEDRRKQIFGCIMGTDPCGEYQAYQDVIPGLVASNCGECSPEDKKIFEKMGNFVLENYPEHFKEVHEKFAKQDE